MFLGSAISIECFTNFGYISLSTSWVLVSTKKQKGTTLPTFGGFGKSKMINFF